MPWRVEAVSEANFHLWLDYFDNRALKDNAEWDGCYCQAYLFTADEEKSIDDSEIAYKEVYRQYACDRVKTRAMQGYIAVEDGKVIGWLAAGPANNYPKFPKTDPTTARAVCFVIDPDRRGEGLASGLLEYGIMDLRNRGFTSIEARGVPDGKSIAANYPGPISLYEKFGFKKVLTFDDGYSLMKKELV